MLSWGSARHNTADITANFSSHVSACSTVPREWQQASTVNLCQSQQIPAPLSSNLCDTVRRSCTLLQVLTQLSEALAKHVATQRAHFCGNPSVMWRAFEDPLKLRLAVGVTYSFTGAWCLIV